MDKESLFRNYDDVSVYQESELRALEPTTHNFVVEFGKNEAQISFDLDAAQFQLLLDSERPESRPARWINIWAPNKQRLIVELIGKYYKFSPRLLAIIQTPPLRRKASTHEDHHHHHGFRSRTAHTTKEEDIELANGDTESSNSSGGQIHPSHYSIASQMTNYHSVDVGPRFLCIGANWMHQKAKKEGTKKGEGWFDRLWSWLALCDDCTVITFQEDPGPDKYGELEAIRHNTLSVLRQLSQCGVSTDPIAMQSVRPALDPDGNGKSKTGIEAASNLFYYLFDDWRIVYITIETYKRALDSLQRLIYEDMMRKSNVSPNIEIIPTLHKLGHEIRQSQRMYEGYKNLIDRILDVQTKSDTTDQSEGTQGVTISKSAARRFQRLRDRVQSLVLSGFQEMLEEKDALISTYFNINAQKDSESAARLTRSATLLAKLSVLFLPVSLMTSYFSIQIPELTNAYTAKTYWYSFAVVMCISFVFLFFFSRLLMWFTETMDSWVKKGGMGVKKWAQQKKRSRNEDTQ
ncbi:hypothetical protein F5884DRAFT_791748 [Xylogone sp. PMI_703]|nr:hypothetical protein F5884DRAFT_791748 [Xylogone sp. PMI_703]